MPDGEYIIPGRPPTSGYKVEGRDFDLDIARGLVTGVSFIHKFGQAVDYDASDAFITVWDGADDGLTNAMVYTYSTTADIDSISSSSGSDTDVIRVEGLDGNYNVVIQDVTLTGQTPADLGTSLLRVYRMKNMGSSDLIGTVYCFVSGGTVTAGVPQTSADVRAIISLHIGAGRTHNQTLMAIYTIPAGKTGYMTSFFASSIGAVKTATREVHLHHRYEGRAFQTKHTASIIDAGSSHIGHEFLVPEVLPAKTDIEIVVNTDTGASGVSAGFDLILIDD